MITVLSVVTQFIRAIYLEVTDLITLNYRDSRPIYGQIKDGLRRLIITGAVAPDEKLPSVRAMAMDLAINPNTIQRAYGELETEGYLYSIPGKGSFACPPKDAAAGRREELLDRLRELLAELRFLQVSEAEILEIVQEGVGA